MSNSSEKLHRLRLNDNKNLSVNDFFNKYKAETKCEAIFAQSLIIKTFRLIETTSFFTIKYYFNSNLSEKHSQLIIKEKYSYFYEFNTDLSNIGGSLYFHITTTLIANSFNSPNETKEILTNVNIYLHACIMFNSMDIKKKCIGEYKLVSQSFLYKFTSLKVNVAYPMIGKWYMAVWKDCIDTKNK